MSHSGDVYDGEFKGGVKEGKGIYEYADGSIYDGEFKGGEKKGKGVYKHTDGSTHAVIHLNPRIRRLWKLEYIIIMQAGG